MIRGIVIRGHRKIVSVDETRCEYFFPLFRLLAANSYDQVTNFLQGYVDNELNLNTEDSCKQNCADYKKTRNYVCAPETLCGEVETHNRPLSVCAGVVRDCVDLGDIDTNICHATNPVRRYNYIQYSNAHIIGLPDQPCEFVSKVSRAPNIAPKRSHFLFIILILSGNNMAPNVCQVQHLFLFV